MIATQIACRTSECQPVPQSAQVETLAYDSLLAAEPGGTQPWLLPPVDHVDRSRVLVSGTGLTHLGSVKSRDEMHMDSLQITVKGDRMTQDWSMYQDGKVTGHHMFELKRQ